VRRYDKAMIRSDVLKEAIDTLNSCEFGIMKSGTQEVSCYSSSLIIKYAYKKGFKKEQLFEGIEDFQEILENSLEWTSACVWNTLAQNFEKAHGKKSGILEQAGWEITKNQVSNFQLLLLKIAPMSFLANNISRHFENSICKIIKASATVRDGEASVSFKPDDPSKYSTQICDFNRGCTYSTFKLKGLRNLSFEEISCAARKGDSECCYIVKWTPRTSIIRRVKDFILFYFRDQRSIFRHMQENHQNLQKQYKEILSLKDFYSHIMNAMAEGILWLDPKARITYSNKGFFSITGFEQSELAGKYFSNFLSADRSASEYEEILIGRQREPFVPKTQELCLVTKQGEKRIGSTSIVWVPSEHYPHGFLVSVRDITEHKRVEQKLYASENRYRSLYENSPAVIVGLDLQGNFIYANAAMEEQSGYTEEELKRMHFGQLVAPDADFDANRLIKGRLDQNARLQEVHYKTKSGEWKVMAFNSFPLHDDTGALIGIAGIGVDVTETKRLNEQLIQTQRMDMLGKMAGGLAHDFNNLLSVIMGFSELITKSTSKTQIEHYAENIRKATERAAVLTRNLLTFSRGEIVKKKVFNLNDLVKEVFSFVIPIVPYNVNVFPDFIDRVFYVNGDAGKIHQCVLNLCLNAKDAIDKKTGFITIRLRESQKEGFAAIEVQDTGPGIPPDIIEKIFDPFFSTKKKSTGLGLSVVYGIVRTHGGEISVDSRPGEGALFRIELPTVQQEQSEGKTDKEATKTMPALQIDKSGTIMVVDDDDLMLSLCKETLEKEGYAIRVFTDSANALEWFESESPDVCLILSNVAMPHMDGFEMMRRFREIKEDMRVLWISAYLSPDMKQPSGNDPVLKKPFSSDELLRVVGSILTKQKQVQ